MKHTRHRITKLLSLVALLTVILGLVAVRVASAITPANIPSSIRNLITNYNNGCSAATAQYQLPHWISPQGTPNTDSSTTPVTVAYGTPSLNFQYNDLVFLCKTLINQPPNGATYPGPPSLPTDSTVTGAAALTTHNDYINLPLSASATDLSGNALPAGNVTGPATQLITAAHNNNSRYWFGDIQPGFRYNAPAGGIKQSQIISIVLRVNQRNVFHNGAGGLGSSDYGCVVAAGQPSQNATSFVPPWGCPAVTIVLSFEVDINPNTAPTLTVNAACVGTNEPTTFQVTSGDADSPGANQYSVNWQLQNSSDGGATWTNGPANFGTTVVEFGKVAVMHNVPFVATPLSDAVMHRIVANTNGYGVPRNVPATSPRWGPCNNTHPPAGSITPGCTVTVTASDQDSPGTAIRVALYIDGNLVPPSPIKTNTGAGNHSYKFAIPAAYIDANTHTLTAKAEDITTTGAATGNFLAIGGSKLIGPLAASCGGAITCDYSGIPSVVEINQPFAITMKVIFNPPLASPPSGATFSWTSLPNLNLSPASPHAASTVTTTGASLTLNSPGVGGGVYTFTWSFTSSAGAVPCAPSTITVANSPYFKVYGGDLMAGSGFGDASCTVNPGAQILGFNKDGSPDYAGAGTQLAAFAMAAIDQFATAGAQGAYIPDNLPRNLTFANSDPAEPYGGDFRFASCIPDYSSVPTKATTVVSSGPTISGAGGIVISGQRVHSFNGNVLVNGNITFTAAGWTSPGTIPSFYLIVKGGDIYIDRSVTRLDGVYVAEPDAGGTGGNIYTCTDGASLFDSTGLFTGNPANDCEQKLTINGAFAAQQVWFLRTSGTLGQAAVGESNVASHAAEIFNYSPAVWLSNPFQNTAPSSFKAEAGLPPIL